MSMIMVGIAVAGLLIVWAIEAHEDEIKRGKEINRLIRGNRIWEAMTETNERLTRVRYTKAGGR